MRAAPARTERSLSRRGPPVSAGTFSAPLVITTPQAPQRPTLALVGRVRRRDRRSIHPLHPPRLDFFRCRRGRQIFIKLPRVDLRYVTVGGPAPNHSLFSSAGS